MSAILILLIGIVALALGYVFYGSWLAKKWGVNPDRPTPAHSKFDNKDFVPANPAVLMGHHFSSIAGAGPINGPIQAAVFGWVPVMLWVLIGGYGAAPARCDTVSDRLRLRRRSLRSRDRQRSAGNHRPRPDAFLLYTT